MVELQHFKVDTKRITEGERLDGEGRPQRCILHYPNAHSPLTLPEVHCGVGILFSLLASHLICRVPHGYSPK